MKNELSPNHLTFRQNIDNRLTKLASEDRIFVMKAFDNLSQENKKLVEQLKIASSKKTLNRHRDPLRKDLYKALLEQSIGPGYIRSRLRIAIAFLTIFGVTITEIRKLKIRDIQSLLDTEKWIEIDRPRSGTRTNRAYLNKEGQKFWKDRQKDFDVVFLNKEENSFIFSPEDNHNRSLSRESLTRQINKVMNLVSNQSPDKPHITSHSLRIGYIEELWSDKSDIEFVKYKIGNRK
jgi:site-specific recombinase XerD